MKDVKTETDELFSNLKRVLPDIKVQSKESLTLLNSPIHPEATGLAVSKYDQVVSRMCDRIQKLDAHTGLFFLSHHTSAPRLNYILRTAPIYETPEILGKIDDKVRQTAVSVTNVAMEDKEWTQASLIV